ncbi:MAG: ABC transporter permease, partial [Roseovarius sp.]
MRATLIFGACLTALFAGAALLSFLWVPYGIETLNIGARMQAPSGAHWLGTDHYGRDILSMLMMGGRTSLAVALVAVGIGMGLGVPLGLAAAARRGSWLDEIISRGNDLIFAFP